jgi:hypothetical protein
MKKNIRAISCLCALIVLTLCAAGCAPEPENASSESAWLIGTWEHAERGTEFIINPDQSFRCDLNVIVGMGRVYGELSTAMSGLGPNQYHLKNMRAGAENDPDISYKEGNNTLQGALPGFSNLVGTLTPNEDKSTFTFTSSNVSAQEFFGGIYARKTP